MITKKAICDACRALVDEEGWLWWLATTDEVRASVYKIRLNCRSCALRRPFDSVNLFDAPMCWFKNDKSRKEQVERIVGCYKMSSDDEVWLREIFEVPKPPTIEERVSRLEKLIDLMTTPGDPP